MIIRRAYSSTGEKTQSSIRFIKRGVRLTKTQSLTRK
ncbi:hypothetical protein CP061683_1006A, partial [Chlamydia psittaci 06-1683]